MSRKFLLAALVSLGALTSFVSLPAQADTLRNGFSVERLARVDALLDSYVNDGRIAGVVALVLRDGKPDAPEIVESAIEAVRLWQYTPTLLNRVPVEANITMTVFYDW